MKTYMLFVHISSSTHKIFIGTKSILNYAAGKHGTHILCAVYLFSQAYGF
jgi:hypothetical protein